MWVKSSIFPRHMNVLYHPKQPIHPKQHPLRNAGTYTCLSLSYQIPDDKSLPNTKRYDIQWQSDSNIIRKSETNVLIYIKA